MIIVHSIKRSIWEKIPFSKSTEAEEERKKRLGVKSKLFEVNGNVAIDFTGSGFHARWMQNVLCDTHTELRFLISKAVLKSSPHKNNVAEDRIKSICFNEGKWKDYS